MPTYGHPPAHPAGLHTHVHDGVVHAHDTRADAWIFWAFISSVVAVQVLVFVWKSRSPKSFGVVSTCALWSFPLLNAVYHGSIKFIVAWVLFSLATGYFVRLALRKPLQPSTPRAGWESCERILARCFRTHLALIYHCSVPILRYCLPHIQCPCGLLVFRFDGDRGRYSPNQSSAPPGPHGCARLAGHWDALRHLLWGAARASAPQPPHPVDNPASIPPCRCSRVTSQTWWGSTSQCASGTARRTTTTAPAPSLRTSARSAAASCSRTHPPPSKRGSLAASASSP